MWIICGIISIFLAIVIKAIKSNNQKEFYDKCFNADVFSLYIVLLCGGRISLFNTTLYLLFAVLETYGILRKITDSLFSFFHKED